MRRELNFLLYEWLDAVALTQRPRYAEHDRTTFDAVLETAEQIAAEQFAPHNRKSDLNEPTFDGERVQLIPEIEAAIKAFGDAGFLSAAQDAEFGGMQLPTLVDKAVMAHFMAANVATAGYPFLTIGNLNLQMAHATPSQIQRYATPMMQGRFFGTMCLSEPGAGSSLSDISTYAVPTADGRYRLFGTKMWISGGDHEMGDNIVHLVLARIKDAGDVERPGVKGISLFIVPRYLVGNDGACGERNDVALAGLNHKMGYRGTVNTVLKFGEGKFTPEGAAGAIAELVGEPHQGLRYMFHMMNEARIGVGLGATMLGYAGYRAALDYARTRTQGRAPQSKSPHSPQVPIIEHADVRRMLLAQKAYVEGALALNLYCARLVDDEKTADDDSKRAEATLLLDILTPIAKSWPSQWCLHANDLAIQVHGGYGYTRDFPVEQYYRDNRLNPIHEGTHGIQGLDLLGRKVVMQEGRAFALLGARISDTIAAAASHRGLANYASTLAQFTKRIMLTTQKLYAAGDLNKTLANASTYLEAFGHIVIAWVWLEQALVATRADGTSEADEDFYAGKLQACKFFFNVELPKVAPMLDLLDAIDTTAMDMQPAWF